MAPVAPGSQSPDAPSPDAPSGRAAWLRRLRLPAQPLARHVLLALCGGVVLYLVTIALSPYDDFEIGEIALYVIALAGLSLLTGANGQISLGHGAFMAVGAYTTALLMVHTHTNFVLELLASVGAAAVLGVVIGIPATRLKGPYLAGMTLLLALALPPIADRWSATFGGDQGITTTVPTAPGTINPEQWLSWIQILGALVTMVLLANLMRSRYGRAFRAVRDDEIAASLTGIHVARTKVLAFAISAGCAGLAGAFLGLSTGVVNTGEFPLTLSIQLLAAMVLGGTGTLMGMWWGAVLLVYLPQWSTSLSGDFSLGNGASAYLATIIFGVVLIGAIIVAPTGIQGGLRWAWQRAANLRSGPRRGPPTAHRPRAEQVDLAESMPSQP
jgi:branched-chain amino acid transport system permease protein